MKKLTIVAMLIILILALFAEAPIVSNVTASQRTDGSKIVDITYDVSDTDTDELWIELLLSEDGGATFEITPDEANLTGDVGEAIAPGTSKSIIWAAGAETTGFDGNNFQIKVSSSDEEAVPAGFIFVEGGTFQMGGRFGEGGSNELPLHDVTLDDFYMATTEVTQGEYEAVMGNNPSNTSFGIGDNHPVNHVSWYDVIAYCNVKSIAEGLTPVYSGSGTSTVCNWNANGYRLPTEAEWEYAARGGSHENDNYRYSGCHNESDLPNYTWYSSNGGNYCNEVETKLPNQLGLYDMSGNLYEWCWDWYDSSYYGSSSSLNPHGANNGSARVTRGGHWNAGANDLRVAYRTDGSPSNNYYDGGGFRICRNNLH